MSEILLELERREKTGTGYVKKLRRQGKVPGIFYFHGKESIPFAVSYKSLHKIIGKESALIDAKFSDNDIRKCIVREIQFDPIDHSILHVDLMGILLSEKITVTVPIHLTGTPFGVKSEGGILQQMMREVEVECLPTDIPEAITLDVSDLKIGDALQLKDITADKFRVIGDLDRIVATVTTLRVTQEVVTEEAATAAEPEVISRRAEKPEEEENK